MTWWDVALKSLIGGFIVSIGVASAQDDIIHNITEVRYDFESNALQRAADLMLEASPIIESGEAKAADVNADWKLSVSTEQHEDGCRLTNVSVTLNTEMTLPNWADVEEMNAKIQAEWARYLAALRMHQDGHVEINLNTAQEIKAALLAMEPFETCEALKAAAGMTTATLQAEAEDAHAAYDKKTKFGARQGAILKRKR
jgi:predicted secreted Zn-dependent protease